jgi:hypothetical protein
MRTIENLFVSFVLAFAAVAGVVVALVLWLPIAVGWSIVEGFKFISRKVKL